MSGQGHGRFEDALFQQTQQMRFLESERGKRYLSAFQMDWDRKRGMKHPEGWLWYLTHETLRQADPIYVSPDVTEIIDAACEKFEPEPILPSDPFVPCGFAYFPRSILREDRNGNENGIRAISWIPITEEGAIAAEGDPRWRGLWLSFFSHESDKNGEEENIPFRTMSPLFELQYLHGTFMPFEQDGWNPEGLLEMQKLEELGLDKDYVLKATREQWVLPQVMWRIGQQIVPSRERPQRQTRRDAARHGLSRDDVSVLRLRRSTIDYGDGEGEANYDHRFLVRGHWRWQHYPSLGSKDEPNTHRQVWINPYVKGPDDKPLIIKDRAVEFTR